MPQTGVDARAGERPAVARQADASLARRSAARRHPVSAGGAFPALLAPIAIGPVEPAQPRRLDLAPDEPRPRSPPHRRPHRLPRGPRPRRGGRDLPGGDGRPPHRAADRAHDRRLPAGDRARLPAPRRRGPRRTARGCSSSSTMVGASRSRASPRAPAVAPSAIPSLRFKTEPRALTHAEIAELIEGYAVAARHAAEGGLDGVEVSISHGYLPAQFLSRQSNRRRDDYDGSLKARLRFSREVLTPSMRDVGARDGGRAPGCRRTSSRPAGWPWRTASTRSANWTTPGSWTSSHSCSATPRSRQPPRGSPLPRPRPPPPSPCRRPRCGPRSRDG